MKKLLLTLGILFCTATMMSAQTSNPNPNAPDMKFEKTTHDYGTIKKGDNGDCEFKFTNTGKEPLIITNCRASCGCTVPSCPKEPIMPGQSSTIKVTYSTQRVGVINKQITITSNGKNSPLVLTITGNVLDTSSETSPLKNNDGLSPKAN